VDLCQHLYIRFGQVWKYGTVVRVTDFTLFIPLSALLHTVNNLPHDCTLLNSKFIIVANDLPTYESCSLFVDGWIDGHVTPNLLG